MRKSLFYILFAIGLIHGSGISVIENASAQMPIPDCYEVSDEALGKTINDFFTLKKFCMSGLIIISAVLQDFRDFKTRSATLEELEEINEIKHHFDFWEAL